MNSTATNSTVIQRPVILRTVIQRTVRAAAVTALLLATAACGTEQDAPRGSISSGQSTATHPVKAQAATTPRPAPGNRIHGQMGRPGLGTADRLAARS